MGRVVAKLREAWEQRRSIVGQEETGDPEAPTGAVEEPKRRRRSES